MTNRSERSARACCAGDARPQPSAAGEDGSGAVRVVVAIPVHNEKNYVEGVLARVRAVIDGVHANQAAAQALGHPAGKGDQGATPRWAVSVLVVDDGSTDGTTDILCAEARAGRIALLTQDTNRGYGRALIDAFGFAQRSGAEWVITMDCDEQHEPAMIPRFLAEMATGRYDIVSGSRYLDPDLMGDTPPPERLAVNRQITAELNDRLDLTLTDGFCGFKAHRVRPTVELDLTESGYAFPMQLWVRAVAHGLSIGEVAVPLIYNDPGRTFGNGLDDREARLNHYRCVMHREIEKVSERLPNARRPAPSGCAG